MEKTIRHSLLSRHARRERWFADSHMSPCRKCFLYKGSVEFFLEPEVSWISRVGRVYDAVCEGPRWLEQGPWCWEWNQGASIVCFCYIQVLPWTMAISPCFRFLGCPLPPMHSVRPLCLAVDGCCSFARSVSARSCIFAPAHWFKYSTLTSWFALVKLPRFSQTYKTQGIGKRFPSSVLMGRLSAITTTRLQTKGWHLLIQVMDWGCSSPSCRSPCWRRHR